MAGRLVDNVFRANPGAIDLSVFGGHAAGPHLPADTIDFGTQTVSGQTLFNGVPGRAKVTLIDRRSLRIIRHMRSDVSGNYEFTNLPVTSEGYIVIGRDENDDLNCVMYDRISSGA